MCAFMGQILQDARIRGWGGRPNFGNARILGAYGPPTHPLRHQDKLNHDDAADQNEWQLTHIQLSTP